MNTRPFKTHTVTRTLPNKVYKNYRSYIPHLKKDFINRCAYCNLLDSLVTTSFEVDHFIPEEAFKGKNESLLTDYENLVYSCKKCNVAKSSQFEGDVYSSEKSNDLFYDPTKVDYSTIFFRNNIGIINSGNAKGRDMITRLKLYRPIYSLGWLCDQLVCLIEKLEEKINSASDMKHIELYREARRKLLEYYYSCNRVFTVSYNVEHLNNKDTGIDSSDTMELLDSISTSLAQVTDNTEDSTRQEEVV